MTIKVADGDRFLYIPCPGSMVCAPREQQLAFPYVQAPDRTLEWCCGKTRSRSRSLTACPKNAWVCLPVATSHDRTDWSKDPEKSMVGSPSAWLVQYKQDTGPLCPQNALSGCCVCRSHARIFSSFDPVYKIPSTDSARQRTASSWPLKTTKGFIDGRLSEGQ